MQYIEVPTCFIDSGLSFSFLKISQTSLQNQPFPLIPFKNVFFSSDLVKIQYV